MQGMWEFLKGFWEWAHRHPRYAYKLLLVTIALAALYFILRLFTG